MLVSLETMFGVGKVPPLTDFIVSRWRQDQFARGAYSFPFAGLNLGKDCETLGVPLENVVWFAVEAAHDHYWSISKWQTFCMHWLFRACRYDIVQIARKKPFFPFPDFLFSRLHSFQNGHRIITDSAEHPGMLAFK